MHDIEPFWNWRHRYTAEEDERSPFHGRIYSEFEFTHAVYDHAIHPQWDAFGSHTLYLKILYSDYEEGFAVIELIGEWNDLLHNDIMYLKRDIVEHLMAQGIGKFILIGENVLNFHTSDESYYEEWWDEAEDAGGWIALLNFRDHVLYDMRAANIDQYFLLGGRMNEVEWRTYEPEQLFRQVERYVVKRLGV
ncbi:MAG: hypothetical protein H6595_08740 [Flavobacteriales bacterium]|nr:hypothetical protein [Flavobacteriales bacterium]MCB9167553.1 hypothetical protein [Flavobacteriales bacterium]